MRVASKTAYTSLRIILVYECNANVVYFDGVQLFTASGQRISKTVNGTTYNYHYLGDQLVEMAWGANRMHFTYDAVGPLSVNFNGTEYFYLKNAQGDVTGLVDSTGAKVVAYTYGPWGEAWGVSGTLASTLGAMNPLRYRGYVYDAETGLYYLNSRYYNPVWGRFINADGFVSTGQGISGGNMFAYCGNNPVNHSDSSGMFWKKIGSFFKGIGTAIANFTKSFFGAESQSFMTTAKKEVVHIPDPLPITAKTGVKTTQTIAKHGDASKPISVYTKTDISHPIKSSSAGIKFNLGNVSLDISLGLDNSGIKGSIKNGNTTNSFGVKLNLSELKLGFESATSYMWDDMTQTTYANVDVSGWAFVVAYCLFNTGQTYESPSYFYGN